MKNTKNAASILYSISAICFYICSAIEFFSGDETSMAVMHLCLGGTFLCLAVVNINKQNSEDTDSKNASGEDKKDEEDK